MALPVLFAPLALHGAGVARTPDCPDYLLSRQELRGLFDRTLQRVQPYVLASDVQIRPEAPACYVQLRVDFGLQGLKLCTARACSVGLVDGTRVGLQRFTISGCDDVLQMTGLPRSLPTAWTDVRERIQQHCGDDRHRLAGVAPTGEGPGAALRLSFRGVP